jgi:poly(3-hydroxybutyrate) depolymerase
MARSSAVDPRRRAIGGAAERRGVIGISRRLTTPARRQRVSSAPVLTLIAAIGPASAREATVSSTAAPSVVRSIESGPLIPRGRVVRRMLRAGSKQEYLLYIPGMGGKDAPVFVTVHGISRNFVEHATLFAPFAERYGVVLVAPIFAKDTHDDYQRLWHEGSGRRADSTLDAVLAEVDTLTGAHTNQFYITGFSGGAQFAHRYTMVHPERILAAVINSAGWYTFPDSEVAYPYGICPSPELKGVRFRPRAFLRVPITVFVGGADTGSVNLRQNPEVDAQQGKTRRERAHRWVAAMQRAARERGEKPLVTLETVPGIGHSFREFMEHGDLGDRVFTAMFGPAPRQAPRRKKLATGRRRNRSRRASAAGRRVTIWWR